MLDQAYPKIDIEFVTVQGTLGPRDGDPPTVCRPLGVEVYRVAPELLQDWQAPPLSAYRGLHGMRLES